MRLQDIYKFKQFISPKPTLLKNIQKEYCKMNKRGCLRHKSTGKNPCNERNKSTRKARNEYNKFNTENCKLMTLMGETEKYTQNSAN